MLEETANNEPIGTIKIENGVEMIKLGNGSWFDLSNSPIKTNKQREEFVLDIRRMKR